MNEVPAVGGFVRYVCVICDLPTDDEPRYVHTSLDWPQSGESQGLGAHTA